MKKNTKKLLEDHLFKMIRVKGDQSEKIMVIFGHESTTSTEIGNKGTPIKVQKDFLRFINITDTLNTGSVIIDYFNVDIDDFLKNVEILSPIQQMGSIVAIAGELEEEVAGLTGKIADCMSALMTLKALVKDVLPQNNDENSGNIIFGGTTEPLAQIVFKTVSGAKVNIPEMLKPDDVVKIGMILKNIVEEHVSDDLTDEKLIKRLEAEIEFKIIDALPNNLKAGDVRINTKAIVDEITSLRNHKEDSGDFDE